MMGPQSLQVRRMTPSDVSRAMRLKGFPGWNQASEGWLAFMALEPGGCFVGEVDGDVVASATAFNYEARFGWIGMILVDPAVRRQGIGTRMMQAAIGYLESVACSC